MSTDINKFSQNHTLGVKMGEARDAISTESPQRYHRGRGCEGSVTPWKPGHGVRSPFCSWTDLKPAWAENFAGPGVLTGREKKGPRP